MTVRPEAVGDLQVIRRVNVEAFKTLAISTQTEHLVVEALRATVAPPGLSDPARVVKFSRGAQVPDTRTTMLQCPYCWEQIEVIVDCSVSHQEYIEDCSVCCRPIVVTVDCSQGELVGIRGRSEDE